MGREVAWALAFAVFLLLRSWGIDFGEPPRMAHPDERYAVIAERMSWSDLNPHYYLNPPLYTYALFGARELSAVVSGREATRAWVEAGGLKRLARWISAVAGALTALIVAAAARWLLQDEGMAWAAGLVVGLSFLHGRDSHYGVNDVPMVFLVATTMLFAGRGLVTAGYRWLALAMITAGLASATKYNGAVAVALPVVALLLPRPMEARPLDSETRRWRVLGLALLFAASFAIANPFSVLARAEFAEGFAGQLSSWGDRPVWGQPSMPGWLAYGSALRELVGVAHLVAAALGAVWMLRDRPVVALMLIVTPSLYLAGMLTKQLFYYRFALPLLPFVAMFAAAGWSAIAGKLSGRMPLLRRRRVVLAVLLVLASWEPASKLVRHDILVSRDHTWMQAVDWIEANVATDERIFLEGAPKRVRFPAGYRVLSPPERGLDLLRIAERNDAGVAVRAVDQGGLLITDSYHERSVVFGDFKRRPQMRFYPEYMRRLREHFELVAEFAPGPDGDPAHFVIDSRYSPLTDLWDLERPGHTIRIWRIEPGAWLRHMAL